jgi:hypothetical protein
MAQLNISTEIIHKIAKKNRKEHMIERLKRKSKRANLPFPNPNL